MKYISLVRKYFNRRDKPVFSYSELRMLDIPRNYIKVLLHHMVRRGEIVRIRRGWYSFHRDPIIFIFTLPPNTAYYGLGFAAHIYDVWDQVPNPEILTYIAPRKIRVGTYIVLNTPIIIRKISRKMFYGYGLIRYGEWNIPISTPEKILIDMVYYNYPFIDEIIPNLLEKIDIKRIKKMTMNRQTLSKRVDKILSKYV